MVNIQYKLTEPKSIEEFYQNINYNGSGMIVRPTYLSICKADLRYYFGERDVKILRQRLPMALIHEACGIVLKDSKGKLRPGQSVIMLPNISGRETLCEENYRIDSLFCASRVDGFMQEMVAMPEKQVMPYHGLPPEIAVLTEFISVGIHAIRTYRARLTRLPERLAVFGDGAMGYTVCALLRKYFPEAGITMIGKHRSKMETFRFADERIAASELNLEARFDGAFECVGRQASRIAIDQIIDVLVPEGTAVLMGVSEQPIPINTRMLLEKGLTLVGRSRSAREDFASAISILENDPVFRNRMQILISEVMEIQGIDDMHRAFNRAKEVDFKLIMNWNI